MTGGLCRMWSVPRGLLHGLGGAGGPWDIHTWWYNSQWYVSQWYIRGKIGWGRFVRSYKPVRMGCPSAPTLRQGFSRENYDKSWGHIEFLRHAHSNSQTSWHSGDSSMPNVLNQTLFWDHEGKGLTHVCLKHKHKLTGCHSLPWCIYVFFSCAKRLRRRLGPVSVVKLGCAYKIDILGWFERHSLEQKTKACLRSRVCEWNEMSPWSHGSEAQSVIYPEIGWLETKNVQSGWSNVPPCRESGSRVGPVRHAWSAPRVPICQTRKRPSAFRASASISFRWPVHPRDSDGFIPSHANCFNKPWPHTHFGFSFGWRFLETWNKSLISCKCDARPLDFTSGPQYETSKIHRESTKLASFPHGTWDHFLRTSSNFCQVRHGPSDWRKWFAVTDGLQMRRRRHGGGLGGFKNDLVMFN